MTPSPRGSPKSPRSPRNLTINPGSSVRYFSTTPLSPIPPSPLPTSAAPSSGFSRPHSPGPISPTWQSRPTSPRPGSSSGHCRPQSPIIGNLARLASRRRSNAVGYRRTSNFLELPGRFKLRARPTLLSFCAWISNATKSCRLTKSTIPRSSVVVQLKEIIGIGSWD